MPTDPQSPATLPTPELVEGLIVRTWKTCGENIGRRLAKYDIGGVRVYNDSPINDEPLWVCNVEGGCVRLECICSRPGIRSALVGALRSWLRTNSTHYRTSEGIEVSVCVWTGKFEGGSDIIQIDPDPLRALCLAALAVAEAKKEAGR